MNDLIDAHEEIRQLKIRAKGQSVLIDTLNSQAEKRKKKYVSLVQRNSRLVGQRDTAGRQLGIATQKISELSELLRAMTVDYACCLSAGFERIISLGGDCDSVEKMLADNPNYAKAIAVIQSHENALMMSTND